MVRDTWPRTSKVYCHRAEAWPSDTEGIEQVPVRSCQRRGASIDLVLDRGRENRSQGVFTSIRGGREAIFWQSARTGEQARPAVHTPTARAGGIERLTVVVDSQGRYAYRFTEQQVDVVRRVLPTGDCAVEVRGPHRLRGGPPAERVHLSMIVESAPTLSRSSLDDHRRFEV